MPILSKQKIPMLTDTDIYQSTEAPDWAVASIYNINYF